MKFQKVILLCLAVFLGFTTLAQQRLNMTLLSNLDYENRLSDVWGYVAPDGTEYALVTLDNGISIVDVTDPTNLIENTTNIEPLHYSHINMEMKNNIQEQQI